MMPFMFHSAALINNPGEYRGVYRHHCSPLYQLTANYDSSLTFSNWLFRVQGKRKRGGGGAGLVLKHHQRQRRSIHDIRLNEYMNSNETGPLLFLINGPRGLSSGWCRQEERGVAQARLGL